MDVYHDLIYFFLYIFKYFYLPFKGSFILPSGQGMRPVDVKTSRNDFNSHPPKTLETVYLPDGKEKKRRKKNRIGSSGREQWTNSRTEE